MKEQLCITINHTNNIRQSNIAIYIAVNICHTRHSIVQRPETIPKWLIIDHEFIAKLFMRNDKHRGRVKVPADVYQLIYSLHDTSRHVDSVVGKLADGSIDRKTNSNSVLDIGCRDENRMLRCRCRQIISIDTSKLTLAAHVTRVLVELELIYPLVCGAYIEYLYQSA